MTGSEAPKEIPRNVRERILHTSEAALFNTAAVVSFVVGISRVAVGDVSGIAQIAMSLIFLNAQNRPPFSNNRRNI
jgi:hypothetical protein